MRLGEGAESVLFLEPEVIPDAKLIKNIKMKSIVDGVPEARYVCKCVCVCLHGLHLRYFCIIRY